MPTVSFGAPVNVLPHTNTRVIAVGDFNGDGKADLVTSPSFLPGAEDVEVMLGRGDGTFRPAIRSSGGGIVAAVAVGDFNGDGKADLAVLAGVPGTDAGGLFILLSRGDGTFRAPVRVDPRPADMLAVGDFNHDGKLDVATVDHGTYDPRTKTDVGAGIDVLLGRGDGTFAPPIRTAGDRSPRAVVAADFNHDGKLDLAIADDGHSFRPQGKGNNGGVVVFLGRGDGRFHAPATFAAGRSPAGLAVGDFNRDGRTDLAAVDGGLSDVPFVSRTVGRVSVLLGRGDGTFGSPSSYAAGDQTAVVVADINGDGKPDLVTTEEGNLSNPTTQQRQAAILAAIRRACGGVICALPPAELKAIVNRVANQFRPENVGAGVVVLLGRGDGTFQNAIHHAYEDGQYPAALTVGDFDRDGRPDLATAEFNGTLGPPGVHFIPTNGGVIVLRNKSRPD